jgi:hypothetical protein
MTDDEFIPQARRRARELAAFAEQAVNAGVQVTHVTPDMCVEYTRQTFAVRVSPKARARAARNGGMGRSLKLREHLFKEA